MVSYGIVTLGLVMLYACLISSAASGLFLAIGHFGRSADSRKLGYRLVYVSLATIFVSALTIVIGFYTHNVAFQYVAQNYPSDTGSLFWLYQLSGLWAGRAGSLLLWGVLIACFAGWVAWSRRKQQEPLTTVALLVIEIVIVLFCATMLFSSSNNPFIKTAASYIADDGSLTGTAMLWGMNVLLEHWAMVLHPPMLFIGYAGLTVPFAYGVAALVVNDPSKRWVDLCQRIALFAFIFLTIGIGLGAVWAYVVLGWGGYWGWDPVENASLLSWLTSVAMLHSFNTYRRRLMMRGWALLSATLSFVFVVMGTFITRSGLVQSVHAFSSDTVSTVLFLVVMIAALLVVLVGWIVRRKSFASADDIESVVSKNGSFYLTALLMIFSGILLAYLTVASALPGWLPAGGVTIGTGAYATIARPLGIVVCLLAAICPFLSWKRTDGRAFWRNVRVPGVIALVVFVLLMVIFVTKLLPAYADNVAAGGAVAEAYTDMGPAWYYNGLAVVGMLAAALLAANSAYLLVRGVRDRMAGKGEGAGTALAHLFVKSPAAFGGYLTHLGLGIVLVGLIGSSMYITERTYNVTYGAQGVIQVGNYELSLAGIQQTQDDETGSIFLNAPLSVTKDGQDVGTLTPNIEVLTTSSMMGQTKSHAQVRSTPLEDLFCALAAQQDESTGQINALYLSVRVNPLISLVWVGFAVMVVGIVCATLPRRGVSMQAHALEGDGVSAEGSSSAKPAPSKASAQASESAKQAGGVSAAGQRPRKARPKKSR